MNFLLLKDFLASRIVMAGFFLVVLAGLIGIYNGKRHLDRLKANTAQTAAVQQEHIQRNVAFFNKDMGLLLYYLRFAYVNQPSELNGLFIGQRDVNNSIQFINIRNLEAQKYDADLYNPVNLLAGNLDFGFVLLYLFPLLIIAVCYNLYAEEKEGGTWPLVAVQSRNPKSILLKKMGIRAMLIMALLAFLFAIAIPVLAIPFTESLVAAMVLSLLYLVFWFVLCFWVVSWRKSSAVSAVSLLSIWVLLHFVLPAAVNNYIIARYPVPEALATTVEQREGYHAKWDQDKKPTMEAFYAHYPQFSKYGYPDENFSWLWYYAMQQGGDDDAKDELAEMKAKLNLRSRSSNMIAAFIPSIHVQQQLNRLSLSDLDNHLRFLDSTELFHEKLRLHFYPKIFEGAEAKAENWHQFQPVYFHDRVKPDWAGSTFPVLLIIALLMGSSAYNLRQGRLVRQN